MIHFISLKQAIRQSFRCHRVFCEDTLMMTADTSPQWEFLFVYKGNRAIYIPKLTKKCDKGPCLFSLLKFPWGLQTTNNHYPPNLLWGYSSETYGMHPCQPESHVLTLPRLPCEAQCSTRASLWPSASLFQLSSTKPTTPGEGAHFLNMLFILIS